MTNSYSYDAYGVMLGGNPTATSPAATNYLYTGEQFDEHAQHYYLRARYYNPLNGRFNRMDPYAGSPQDPQSLHKYLYCHANPINGSDPTGLSGDFTLVGTLMTLAIMTILMSPTTLNAPVVGRPTSPDDSGELVYDLGWSLLIVVGGAVGAKVAAKLGARLLAGTGTRIRKLVKWPRGFRSAKHFKDVCRRIAGSSNADDVVVGIRGSSVTNKSFTNGTPFGPGKDLDLFVVSDDLYERVVKAGAKTGKEGLLRVSATKNYAPELHALEKQLSEELGHKVTVRIFSKEGFNLVSKGVEILSEL